MAKGDIDVAAWEPDRLVARLLGDANPGWCCLRLGEDHDLIFGRDAFRHRLAVACMIRAAGGPEAVAADMPPPGLVDSYRTLYGDWGACYQVEGWYARFAGPRRRIMARLVPDRDECLRLYPPLPEGYVAPRTFEEALQVGKGKPMASPPAPKARRKEVAGQGSLF